MKKRILLLTLILILTCSLLALSVSAADIIASGQHDFGPITWTVTSDGILTISGNRSMQYKNTYEWADYADRITRVVIEDGITNIPKNAFSNYSKLESVYIGNTVTVIDEEAFAHCSKLKNVTIPASVTEIAKGVFYNCTSLKDVSFESGSKLETLGGSAFEGSGLTKVTLPSSLQKIGDCAYAECESLTEAILPEGLVTIGQYAFQDCNALKVVGLPSTLEQIMYDAFLRCLNIQRMEINSSCELADLIPYQDSLTTVVFGDSVTSIPRNAFSGCANLTNVTIGKSVEVIGRNSFRNCTALKSVTIPSSVLEIAIDAFYNTGLSSVVIPDSVKELGSRAFFGCSNLESVQLGKNITVIQGGTFAQCTSLKKISLKNVTEVGSEAFEGCTALSNVEFGTLKSIVYCAFKDCSALKEIILPETLESMDFSIFVGSGLETIYFEGDAPVFNSSTFDSVSCLAIYPADNKTWTEEVLQNYGGSITWKPSHIHEYSAVVTAPTCTEQGYTTYTCSTCGNTYQDAYVDALGHTWDDGIVTKEPTREETGICIYTCSVCMEIREDIIPTPSAVQRISGKSRVDTALSVAQTLKETLGVAKFNSIIIAIGDNEKFADALAGSYLANVKDAPILLYANGKLADSNVTFIKENLKAGGTVYILGGTGAIPASVEETLSAYTVKRLSGKTRYETNLAILNEAGVSSANEILIATGTNFADSLSASATGLPIMLVEARHLL